MNQAFVLWQDTDSRLWYPVAQLSQGDADDYVLNYTKGANKNPKFQGFIGMEDWEKEYHSKGLFTFLRNRILPESRAEHDKMFEWSALPKENKDYLSLLALSGGEKRTDNFRLIKIPEIVDNQYYARFFVSGISYLDDNSKADLAGLKSNDALAYELEDDNPKDNKAVLLLSQRKVGYLPAYLCSDFRTLLGQDAVPDIRVVQYNTYAPTQYQLLCELRIPTDREFIPLNDDEFQKIES